MHHCTYLPELNPVAQGFSRVWRAGWTLAIQSVEACACTVKTYMAAGNVSYFAKEKRASMKPTSYLVAVRGPGLQRLYKPIIV